MPIFPILHLQLPLIYLNPNAIPIETHHNPTSIDPIEAKGGWKVEVEFVVWLHFFSYHHFL